MSGEEDRREDSPPQELSIKGDEYEEAEEIVEIEAPGPMDSSPEILEMPRSDSSSPPPASLPDSSVILSKEPSPALTPPTPPPTAQSSSISLSKAAEVEELDDDELEDFEDESLMERLLALSEIFPPGLVSGTASVACAGLNTAKWVLANGKVLTWAIFSSAGITFLPIIIESERSRIVEAEKQQQRQILLGPGAAVA